MLWYSRIKTRPSSLGGKPVVGPPSSAVARGAASIPWWCTANAARGEAASKARNLRRGRYTGYPFVLLDRERSRDGQRQFTQKGRRQGRAAAQKWCEPGLERALEQVERLVIAEGWTPGAHQAAQFHHGIARALYHVRRVIHRGDVALELLFALERRAETIGDSQLQIEVDVADAPVGEGGRHRHVAGEKIWFAAAQGGTDVVPAVAPVKLERIGWPWVRPFAGRDRLALR